MVQVDKSIRMTSLAVTTAMAGALLSGCAAHSAPRAEVSANSAIEAMAEGRDNRAIRHAEAAVQAEPRNASYRAMLGNAYLEAGRFAAAQTSFDDAMLLGDNSPRTALSLALALTAQAKYSEAAALLNDWEGEIATADYGLAMALAGQPERGIHLMSNAIRGGENTVKMRQNLAYAYAMAGRWREARLMAAEDIPADQVGDRMAQWAEMANPLAFQRRVAGLLGVPAGVQDAGQPIQLALANNPGIDQLAAEASVLAAENTAAAPQVAVAETTAVPASGAELPAVGTPDIGLDSYEAPKTNFAEAFAMPSASERAPAPIVQDSRQFAAAPVVQPASTRYESNSGSRASTASHQIAEAPVSAARPIVDEPEAPTTRSSLPRAFRAAMATVDGSHLVQLGSFSSEQGARRAWGIYVNRYPELENHQMVITEAVVRGKRYFRVSASGYDQMESHAMCNRVDAANGDGCISWAAASPLPGAVDNGIRFAMR